MRRSPSGAADVPRALLCLGALLLVRGSNSGAGNTLGHVRNLQKELEEDLRGKPAGSSRRAASPFNRSGQGHEDEKRPASASAAKGVLAGQQTRSRPFSVACPAKPSLLFARALRSHERMSGRPDGLLAWDPPASGKYLVVYCRAGQISNWMLCLRNHIILAGLLNRTLVIDTSKSSRTGGPRFDWSLLMDPGHLRRCFGARAVVTTSEYAAQNKGEKLQVDEFACWGVDPFNQSRSATKESGPVRPDFDRANVPHCAEEAVCREVKVKQLVLGFNLSKMSFSMVCALTLREVITVYGGGRLVRAGAIVAGDLLKFGFILPDAMTSYGDAPFVRASGCPNSLAMLPHRMIVHSSRAVVQALFRGGPFLALHLRRGDFLSTRCAQFHWPSACLTTEQVAGCVAEELAATKIRNVVVCTDSTAGEILSLTQKLQEAFANRLVIAFNPMLPSGLRYLAGKKGEGHASLQKLVMARSSVFLGSDHSTFTADVMRIRVGQGLLNCRDSFVCERTVYDVKFLDPFVSMLV